MLERYKVSWTNNYDPNEYSSTFSNLEAAKKWLRAELKSFDGRKKLVGLKKYQGNAFLSASIWDLKTRDIVLDVTDTQI